MPVIDMRGNSISPTPARSLSAASCHNSDEWSNLMRIGFIGLGNMGAAIAANLLKAGHEVIVWNRTPARASPLVDAGATIAATPKDAAAERAVVITMLADDAALEAVLHGETGLLAGLDKGALHVSMSTIAVATAERLTEQHHSRGHRFLCAPVFGRPEAAAAGKLFIIAGGDPADIELAEPVFRAAGQRVFGVGKKPSAASLVKLCGNFMILAAIESMAEAMTLAEKGGVQKAQLLEVLTGSLFDAPLFRNYGKALVDGRFRPAGFTAPLGLKDMRLAAQSADTLRVPMPLLGVLRDHLLQTIAVEGEDIDWSGIGLTIAKNGGL
jgi:3-hydroxyisobutyrate dehydrogenase-like beta-hydroxyacid dehydrogenase